MNEDTGTDRGHASQIAAVPAFSFEACFSHGWEVFRSNYGLLLGVGIVNLLILGTTYFLAMAFLAGGNPILQWAIDIFFSPVLAAGVVYMPVQMARGKTPEFGDMFAGFRLYWPVVGISFLIKVIGWLIMAPSMLALTMGMTPATGSTFFLLLGGTAIIAAVVFARLSFGTIVCLDEWTEQPKITECIAASWRMTGEWRWVSLIVLGLAMGLVYLVSLLVLVLPVLLIALPFSMAVWGCAYATLAPNSKLIGAGHTGVCWNCSQPTIGLPTTTCPECGRDFTRPGSVF